MFPERSVRVLTGAKNVNVSYIFDLRSHVQSTAMVAKKLLVDDKIAACVKGICKVLNRKTLSGSSPVKHFAFLKISKFCSSSNLLVLFYELLIGPQLTFLKCCYFPAIRLVNFV